MSQQSAVRRSLRLPVERSRMSVLRRVMADFRIVGFAVLPAAAIRLPSWSSQRVSSSVDWVVVFPTELLLVAVTEPFFAGGIAFIVRIVVTVGCASFEHH